MGMGHEGFCQSLVKTRDLESLLSWASYLELPWAALSHWCCPCVWPQETCWEVTFYSWSHPGTYSPLQSDGPEWAHSPKAVQCDITGSFNKREEAINRRKEIFKQGRMELSCLQLTVLGFPFNLFACFNVSSARVGHGQCPRAACFQDWCPSELHKDPWV